MAEEVGMLKKFRKRFMLITMLLVGVVAFIAFGAVGVNEYNDMRAEIGAALNRGVQPVMGITVSTQDDSEDDANSKNNGKGDEKGKFKHTIDICSVLVSYSNPDANVVEYNSAGIDEDTLKSAIEAAYSKYSNGEGTEPVQELSDYGLYYKVSDAQVGLMVAFVPKSLMMEDIGEQVIVLVGAWLLLMLAVFVITFFLSRYVARPVERAWKDQQRFIADASHELKTPLTVIMADVSILRDSPEKTVREQSNWVEGISSEAERMKQLTEDLLTLAQADAGVDMRQIMGDVDFSSVVESQVLQFDAVAFERGLAIDDDVEESLHVTGDEMRLENMVKTLLENACKYAERSSAIDVTLGRERGDAVLKIHNAGDPIPPEDLPHLFDRFYRSDKARTHDGEAASFGLGLSIAKSTAEMHKGTIGVKSDAGGTTFTVKLPLAKPSK